MSDPTAELMSVWLGATPDRKTAILKFARGEMPDGGARPVTGPLFLNMTKAAEVVGVSRTSLWRLVKSGKLQRVELHRGCFRLRRADLLALAEGKTGANEQTSLPGRLRKGSPPSAPAFAGELRRGDSAATESEALAK